MRYAAALLLFLATPAAAGTPEAREVARLDNCPPKKIEVYQSRMGGDGHTVYQVTCNLPKQADAAPSGSPDALLVDCDGPLCTVLRPVSLQK